MEALSEFRRQVCVSSATVCPAVAADGRSTHLALIEDGEKMEMTYLHLLHKEVPPWVEGQNGGASPIVLEDEAHGGGGGGE